MSDGWVSIAPLLKTLTNGGDLSDKSIPGEVAAALGLLFENQLLPTQCASLLTSLRLTGLDENPEVIAACAQAMRGAADHVDESGLRKCFSTKTKPEGNYHGGLCDIVGTGGDGHSTFNVSTASSIIASAILVVAKHGAQASSSKSGSADVLMAIKPDGPNIEAVTAGTVQKVYQNSSYGFLFAKQFHPGMKHVMPVRKQLAFRTIFNILGPLANPMYRMMEAGVYGVFKKSLGPVYANALRLCGAQKAMVVCGAEDLDEISCAGKTNCWRLITENGAANTNGESLRGSDGHEISGSHEHRVTRIEEFQLQPSDFGLPAVALKDVLPGREPEENADLLMKMLNNELSPDHSTLHFVLMNTAALLVIAGVCDADHSTLGTGDDGKVIKEVGPGGGRWKEGVRRARWAIESGKAAESLRNFIAVTQDM